MIHISKSLSETKEIARNFLKTLGVESPEHRVSGATVVALRGDLGSGKTAFAQAAGEALGVEESMQSPTFVIMKIYKIDFEGFKNLIHIDAYRIDEEKELLHLGWEEIISEPENLVLIEWSERVPGIIPNEAIFLDFEFVDETTRQIDVPKLEVDKL